MLPNDVDDTLSADATRTFETPACARRGDIPTNYHASSATTCCDPNARLQQLHGINLVDQNDKLNFLAALTMEPAE